tara:strand:+ start:2797 stop:3606 length:810 start_codon:yes stop_codon:yes gene_type:complete
MIKTIDDRENLGIIIQARMTSTRLPGKILKDVFNNLTMLEAVIDRVNNVKKVSQIIVATTVNNTDYPVIKLCQKLKAKYPKLGTYRGDENNVLSRFYFAGKEYGLHHLIRITSDCPVIDSDVINNMVEKYFELYRKGECDYMSNIVERTFPRGLDAEIFTFKSLETAFFDLEVTKDEMEHVTAYIYSRPKKFKIKAFSQEQDFSKYRLTVDCQKDLDLIKLIYNSLYCENPKFKQNQIIELLQSHPDWLLLNHDVEMKFHSQRHYNKSK